MKAIFYVIFGLIISQPTFAEQKGKCIGLTSEKLCIELEWIQGPFIDAYSKNIVRFKDLKKSTSESPVYATPKGSLQFYSWMIMHGHEHGGRPVVTSKMKEGIFENSKIYYMGGMMGTWQFKLKIDSTEFLLHSLSIEN